MADMQITTLVTLGSELIYRLHEEMGDYTVASIVDVAEDGYEITLERDGKVHTIVCVPFHAIKVVMRGLLP